MSRDPLERLTYDDLVEIAAGVLGEVPIRDAGSLAAAAERPWVTVGGKDAYPTFEEKAAALLHSVVRNHALVDGNKRLAWSATRVFFLLNGHDLAYTVDGAETMILRAAAGELDLAAIAAWLLDHRREP